MSDLWTGEQLAAFQHRWEQANTPAARAAHMRRETRRLLPLRTRLRLWRDRQLTSAGAWLLDRGRERACVVLWPVTGLWSGPLAMIPAGINAEPLAVWDCNDPLGLFQEHLPEAAAWANAHLGQEVANRTYRVDFHLIGVPFAVLYQIATDRDGRKLAAGPPAGGPRYADPVVQLLDELPPAHLLGR